MKNNDRIWYRRLASLLMAMVMLTMIPLDTVSAASAQSDSQQKVKAGDIVIGTATLYGQDGISLDLGFAYSDGCVLNEAAVDAINDALANFNCGLDGSQLKSDSITKQRFFAVGMEGTQQQNAKTLSGQLEALKKQGSLDVNTPVSGSDQAEQPVEPQPAEPQQPDESPASSADIAPAPAEPEQPVSSSQVVSPSGNSVPSGGSVSSDTSLPPFLAPAPAGSPSDAIPTGVPTSQPAEQTDPAAEQPAPTAEQPAPTAEQTDPTGGQTDATEPLPGSTATPADSDSDFNIGSNTNIVNSIESAFFPEGSFRPAALLTAYNSLESSFRFAFPEFNISEIKYIAIPAEIFENSSVSPSDSNMSCYVTITPEPVVINHSVFGEEVTSIMVAPLPYEYNVRFAKVTGLMNGVIAPPPTTTAPTTAAETTQTEATTTTEEYTTTTTAETTTTTTTTTTTAMTTAPTSVFTEFTTAPTTAYTTYNGYGRSGYVNTRRKRLRLRSTPHIQDDNIITYMPKGTHLTILNTENPKWYYVRMDDGQEGYCWAGYVGFN